MNFAGTNACTVLELLNLQSATASGNVSSDGYSRGSSLSMGMFLSEIKAAISSRAQRVSGYEATHKKAAIIATLTDLSKERVEQLKSVGFEVVFDTVTDKYTSHKTIMMQVHPIKLFLNLYGEDTGTWPGFVSWKHKASEDLFNEFVRQKKTGSEVVMPEPSREEIDWEVDYDYDYGDDYDDEED